MNARRLPRPTRRAWLIGAAGASATLAAPAIATPAQAQRLRLAYLPIVNCAAVFMAQARGLFAAHGVAVDLVRSAGGERVIAALRSGQVDVGFSNVASMLFAADEGAALLPLTGGAMSDTQRPVHGVFVRADSALRSVRDLRGQRIAVNTVKAIDEVMLSALIRREGGDAAGNRFVPINFPAMQPALLAGEVDAVVVIEPFVALAQAEPALRRISTLYAELQPVTEISAFVARSGLDLATRSPAARLRSALQAAARHANRYPEQVRELLPGFVDVERSALQRAVLPHFMERQLDSARLDETIRIMQSAGWIGPQLRAARLLDAANGPTSVLHPRWQTRNASRQA